MNRWTPSIYLVEILLVFSFIWYMYIDRGAEDRLTGLFWALPAILVGSFTTLWRANAKLERRLAKLERGGGLGVSEEEQEQARIELRRMR